MHLRRLFWYTFFVITTTFALDHRARSMRRTAFHLTDEPEGSIICFMYFLCPKESQRGIQISFDIILYIIGIPFLLKQAWRHARFSIHDFDPNGDLDFSLNELLFFFYKNLTAALCVLIAGFLLGAMVDRTRNGWDHWFDSDPAEGRSNTAGFAELPCLSVVTLLMYCNLLHLLLPFKTIGPVLITVWRMVSFLSNSQPLSDCSVIKILVPIP